MNAFLTLLAMVAFVLLVVFLLGLLVLLVYRRRRATRPQPAPPPQAAPVAAALLPHPKEVHVRVQGERGAGGPSYGDVLCADGVYLPEVWEADLHTSFDGRWIRTSAFDGTPPRLLDRKTRRSWTLSAAEAAAVDGERWRLPRWRDEAARAQGGAEGSQAFSDGAFEAWLQEHVSAEGQALVAVRDLWLPADLVPPEDQQVPPLLVQPDAPPVQLAIQRHWPASLRSLRWPMEAVLRPRWKLLFGEVPQPWGVDVNAHLVWREDGQAFAFYGSALAEAEQAPLCLVAWSVQHGWLQWPDALPADRKPWSLAWTLPQAEAPAAEAALRWDGEVLLQRMEVQSPELERLHDGCQLHDALAPAAVAAGRDREGRLLLQPVPRTVLYWRRHLDRPAVWQALSAPVAGQPLCWTLAKQAVDEPGGTAAYALQWGETRLSGLWELEHVVIQGHGAALLQHGASPLKGETNTVQLWDGRQLQTLATTWPVLRLRPVPGPQGGQALRLQLLALTGSVPTAAADSRGGAWRWPVQPATALSLARTDWSACYAWREAAPDAQGRWRVLPRWREVAAIPHPCADGDYVWRLHEAGDALWWWGGLHKDADREGRPDVPRGDGVSVSRSGAVLCGTGPSACPHPGGEGWVVLELVAREAHEAHHWKLHWLQPGMREVHSLPLRAWLPLLHAWDGAGLHWSDRTPGAGLADAAPSAHQTVAWSQWILAQVEVLYEGPQGLWLRKQDLRYADAVLARDDWPWRHLQAAAAA